LLHGGFVQDRGVWHELGYVKRLAPDFTVITVDIRGHGESQRPMSSGAYAIENLIDDVHSVANACGAGKFSLWGFSLGGSIAMQLAAHSSRLQGAVIAASFLGEAVREYAARNVPELKAAVEAQQNGRLDELPLGPAERSFVEQVDLRLALAVYEAMMSWPTVAPGDVRCPTYIYVGSADRLVLEALQRQRAEMEGAGLHFDVLDALGHFQALNEVDHVLPNVSAFLTGLR
ncbi:MAG: alpha/beta fold hydrolase, partial [Acidiferrobacterales bacterium]